MAGLSINPQPERHRWIPVGDAADFLEEGVEDGAIGLRGNLPNSNVPASQQFIFGSPSEGQDSQNGVSEGCRQKIQVNLPAGLMGRCAWGALSTSDHNNRVAEGEMSRLLLEALAGSNNHLWELSALVFDNKEGIDVQPDFELHNPDNNPNSAYLSVSYTFTVEEGQENLIPILRNRIQRNLSNLTGFLALKGAQVALDYAAREVPLSSRAAEPVVFSMLMPDKMLPRGEVRQGVPFLRIKPDSIDLRIPCRNPEAHTLSYYLNDGRNHDLPTGTPNPLDPPVEFYASFVDSNHPLPPEIVGQFDQLVKNMSVNDEPDDGESIDDHDTDTFQGAYWHLVARFDREDQKLVIRALLDLVRRKQSILVAGVLPPDDTDPELE